MRAFDLPWGIGPRFAPWCQARNQVPRFGELKKNVSYTFSFDHTIPFWTGFLDALCAIKRIASFTNCSLYPTTRNFAQVTEQLLPALTTRWPRRRIAFKTPNNLFAAALAQQLPTIGRACAGAHLFFTLAAFQPFNGGRFGAPDAMTVLHNNPKAPAARYSFAGGIELFTLTAAWGWFVGFWCWRL